MSKLKLHIVGQTENGKRVVSGVFKLFDTHGLPLDIIFKMCYDYDLVVDIPELCSSAFAGGWTKKTLINRLRPALVDIYGKDYADTVFQKLNQCGI
jgi:hypothetical protein